MAKNLSIRKAFSRLKLKLERLKRAFSFPFSYDSYSCLVIGLGFYASREEDVEFSSQGNVGFKFDFPSLYSQFVLFPLRNRKMGRKPVFLREKPKCQLCVGKPGKAERPPSPTKFWKEMPKHRRFLKLFLLNFANCCSTFVLRGENYAEKKHGTILVSGQQAPRFQGRKTNIDFPADFSLSSSDFTRQTNRSSNPEKMCQKVLHSHTSSWNFREAVETLTYFHWSIKWRIHP